MSIIQTVPFSPLLTPPLVGAEASVGDDVEADMTRGGCGAAAVAESVDIVSDGNLAGNE